MIRGCLCTRSRPGEAGNWYYAVTEVIGGNENQTLTAGSNSLSSPVLDTVATPQPVLVSTINDGHGRVYTQFMDYENWNPTFRRLCLQLQCRIAGEL